jgi:hypothetical protein
MILTLDTREAEMLRRLLGNNLVELRDEIHHTDRTAFKAELRAEEVLLRGVLQKLNVPAQEGISATGPGPKQVSQSA